MQMVRLGRQHTALMNNGGAIDFTERTLGSMENNGSGVCRQGGIVSESPHAQPWYGCRCTHAAMPRPCTHMPGCTPSVTCKKRCTAGFSPRPW